MESLILLELLKLVSLGLDVVKHILGHKREKAMVASLEKINHRLIQLENKSKEKP